MMLVFASLLEVLECMACGVVLACVFGLYVRKLAF